MHQKVLLMDDEIAGVGTANFDNRSFRLNFEITLLVHDPVFAGQVEDMLQADLRRSRGVSLEEIANKPALVSTGNGCGAPVCTRVVSALLADAHNENHQQRRRHHEADEKSPDLHSAGIQRCQFVPGVPLCASPSPQRSQSADLPDGSRIWLEK